MAYATKQEGILALHPDVVLLQECSEKHIKESGAPFAHWVGKNPHKGLGVLGFGQHDYSISSAYTSTYPWFLPLRVEDVHLNVLGVWAHVNEKQERYVRITHQATDYYRAFLEEGLSLAIGDFNSNTIWDTAHARYSHSALVEKLAQLQMRSVYHVQTREPQGRETVSTFYLYRHPNKGYHIDYAFVSQSLLEKTALTIPDARRWLQRSDHLPLLLDVHLGPRDALTKSLSHPAWYQDTAGQCTDRSRTKN
jgi:endonuclease/exonuclease/phosphatase family metal-dependent hydrolase